MPVVVTACEEHLQTTADLINETDNGLDETCETVKIEDFNLTCKKISGSINNQFSRGDTVRQLAYRENGWRGQLKAAEIGTQRRLWLFCKKSLCIPCM